MVNSAVSSPAVTTTSTSPSSGNFTLTEKLPSFFVLVLAICFPFASTRISVEGAASPERVSCAEAVNAGTPSSFNAPLVSTSASPTTGSGVAVGCGVAVACGVGVASLTEDSSFTPSSSRSMRASSSASGSRPTMVCSIMYSLPRCSVA